MKQKVDVTLYAVALNTHEHNRHPKGLTLVKLNNIKEALPFLPTMEILKVHWAKEYARAKREEILNEERPFGKKVKVKMEPLCIGVKSEDFDAILAELHRKCHDFGLNEEVIGCVISGYDPCCMLCRVSEEKESLKQ